VLHGAGNFSAALAYYNVDAPEVSHGCIFSLVLSAGDLLAASSTCTHRLPLRLVDPASLSDSRYRSAWSSGSGQRGHNVPGPIVERTFSDLSQHLADF
jgi:hypothetical protein